MALFLVIGAKYNIMNRSRDFKINPLLLRADVGHAKPTIHFLPAMEFRYGKPTNGQNLGVKESSFCPIYLLTTIVTMSWDIHKKSVDLSPRRDYAKLNKLFVHEGLHSPKVRRILKIIMCDQAYNEYKAMYNPLSRKPEGQKELSLLLPEPDFRYGRRNRYVVRLVHSPF